MESFQAWEKDIFLEINQSLRDSHLCLNPVDLNSHMVVT